MMDAGVSGESGPLRLGVLVSGEGTSLQGLIDRIADGRLRDCRIVVVISSRSEAGGARRAQAAGIPVEIVRVRDYDDVAAFSAAVVAALERHAVELGVQAGWLCYWRLPERWLGRVINLHPALLPEFGGKGMYGRHVHAAVLAAGRRTSGATVHIVDNEYDHGPTVVQRTCEVRNDDTPDTLAVRVQALERELLPEAIQLMRARVRGERT